MRHIDYERALELLEGVEEPAILLRGALEHEERDAASAYLRQIEEALREIRVILGIDRGARA